MSVEPSHTAARTAPRPPITNRCFMTRCSFRLGGSYETANDIAGQATRRPICDLLRRTPQRRGSATPAAGTHAAQRLDVTAPGGAGYSFAKRLRPLTTVKLPSARAD